MLFKNSLWKIQLSLSKISNGKYINNSVMHIYSRSGIVKLKKNKSLIFWADIFGSQILGNPVMHIYSRSGIVKFKKNKSNILSRYFWFLDFRQDKAVIFKCYLTPRNFFLVVTKQAFSCRARIFFFWNNYFFLQYEKNSCCEKKVLASRKKLFSHYIKKNLASEIIPLGVEILSS